MIAKRVQRKRCAAKGIETNPTPLPEERVQDTLVFEVHEVDLTGSLYLKEGEKMWIMLCTCAVYHALHFKLITNLSTNGFMLGLRRFIARQGRPKVIYSERGTNFFGAENLLKSLDWTRITQEASILRIHWKPPPPLQLLYGVDGGSE